MTGVSPGRGDNQVTRLLEEGEALVDRHGLDLLPLLLLPHRRRQVGLLGEGAGVGVGVGVGVGLGVGCGVGVGVGVAVGAGVGAREHLLIAEQDGWHGEREAALHLAGSR